MSRMLIDCILKASAVRPDSEGVNIVDKLFRFIGFLGEVEVQVCSVFIEVGWAFAREQRQDSPIVICLEPFSTGFMSSD